MYTAHITLVDTATSKYIHGTHLSGRKKKSVRLTDIDNMHNQHTYVINILVTPFIINKCKHSLTLVLVISVDSKTC